MVSPQEEQKISTTGDADNVIGVASVPSDNLNATINASSTENLIGLRVEDGESGNLNSKKADIPYEQLDANEEQQGNKEEQNTTSQ